MGEGDLFCEACGHPLAPPAAASAAEPIAARSTEPAAARSTEPAAGPSAEPAATPSAEPAAAPSTEPAAEPAATTPAGPGKQGCAHCGAPAEEIIEDGYCGRCGMRQPRPGDHRESDLGAVAAAATDRGLRHHRNEDAYELGSRDGRVIAVVCDGVSNSSDPELASVAAAAATLQALTPALEGPAPDDGDARRLLSDAVAQAQLAVAKVGQGGSQAPATTLVAAIVAADLVAVANVGDSRAYWLAENGPQSSRQLSVDDSCAQRAIASGADPAQAYQAQDAHTLTSWLGADADDVVPTINVVASPGPGAVVLCSDGLWNHFPDTEQLSDLLVGDGDRRPIAAVRRMVAAAVAAGGEDNITAIVIPALSRPRPSPHL
ncbi:MAG: PP2C family protein-serine/threonine phosphatase [Solirubrobacteraceae bacterium]